MIHRLLYPASGKFLGSCVCLLLLLPDAGEAYGSLSRLSNVTPPSLTQVLAIPFCDPMQSQALASRYACFRNSPFALTPSRRLGTFRGFSRPPALSVAAHVIGWTIISLVTAGVHREGQAQTPPVWIPNKTQEQYLRKSPSESIRFLIPSEGLKQILPGRMSPEEAVEVLIEECRRDPKATTYLQTQLSNSDSIIRLKVIDILENGIRPQSLGALQAGLLSPYSDVRERAAIALQHWARDGYFNPSNQHAVVVTLENTLTVERDPKVQSVLAEALGEFLDPQIPAFLFIQLKNLPYTDDPSVPYRVSLIQAIGRLALHHVHAPDEETIIRHLGTRLPPGKSGVVGPDASEEVQKSGCRGAQLPAWLERRRDGPDPWCRPKWFIARTLPSRQGVGADQRSPPPKEGA